MEWLRRANGDSPLHRAAAACVTAMTSTATAFSIISSYPVFPCAFAHVYTRVCLIADPERDRHGVQPHVEKRRVRLREQLYGGSHGATVPDGGRVSKCIADLRHSISMMASLTASAPCLVAAAVFCIFPLNPTHHQRRHRHYYLHHIAIMMRTINIIVVVIACAGTPRRTWPCAAAACCESASEATCTSTR